MLQTRIKKLNAFQKKNKNEQQNQKPKFTSIMTFLTPKPYAVRIRSTRLVRERNEEDKEEHFNK